MELKEVFEPVLNFIKNFQKKDKETASKQAAKDRLKLVLMQDRASVSPDFFELMKQEIIDVIKKYIEIDEEALEVELTRGLEAGLEGPALYANIPIKNVKPVAPKNEEEMTAMSEEKAEEVAEQILNQIEESVAKEKEEDLEEMPKAEVKEEGNEETKKEEKEEVKEENKKETKKAPAKKTTKTTTKKVATKSTKTTTKKETPSKAKN